MTRPLRIATFIRKMHAAGTKNLVMEYYRHIDRHKVQFDFICDEDSNAVPEEEIKALGGRVYKIRSHKKLLGNMMDFYRLCKENNYDILHAYDNTANIFPCLVAKAAGVPVRISECLSMGNKGELKSYIKMGLKLFSKCFANYYVACGEECGRWMFGDKTFNKGKVTVFKTCINAEANAYNPKLRKEKRDELGLDDKIIYGFIGRYEPQKNPLFLLEVFNEITKIEENAVLVIIGYGGMRNKMHRQIAAYGLENKVFELGLREDIIPFYNAFDAFLLPSLYEGLPVVGFEAQSAGLPTFFSDTITKEAEVSPLAHYLSLKDTANVWAKVICETVEICIGKRKSGTEYVVKAGYDSCNEAKRLLDYYFQTINEQRIL